MRPVERPILLAADGTPKTFAKYQDARKDLIATFGEYCSYCEMHLDASLAVEHVQPKDLHAGLALSWSNFLLGCTNCNSTKGTKSPGPTNCLWPDRDNTFIAFRYSEGGIVEVNPLLNLQQHALAQALINLVGLDRKVDNASASDRRWLNRRDAWDKAKRALERLGRTDNDDMREQIVETATANGYWSVWLTVFSNDADMRKRFIEAMPGTARNCFNAQYMSITRVNGQV